MACGLTGINSVTDCTVNYGGIVKSYGCKLADITSVTITSGEISNFTMASTGLWKEYIYDADGTANYNQVGSVNNNRFSNEQTAFMKFKGITAAYVAAANTAKDCCDVVFIHVLASGARLVQGFELLSATGAPSRTANRSTRIIPTINSDTTQNEARMEYAITGNANSFSMSTTLNDAAIEAL
jgi:hypothetical protein